MPSPRSRPSREPRARAGGAMRRATGRGRIPGMVGDPSVDGDSLKRATRASFERSAGAYVASKTHATGRDLARLVELAAPRAGDLALDVATGGGHTALA